MPKTRNVTRSQRDTAQTSTTTSTTSTNRRTAARKRNENENNGYESEKENAARHTIPATRLHSRARARAGLLGASNASIAAIGATTTSTAKGEKVAKGKTASKGKGVPPPATIQRKKMPLQDITAEFLPAPEAENRGEPAQEENVDDGAAPSRDESTVNVVVATGPLPEMISTIALPPPKFTSPLPPSSPPSELTQSPSLLPVPSAPQFHDNFEASSSHSIPQATFDPWQEFYDANLPSHDEPKNVSSNSDPFGFVALERKLKAEREAALLMAPDHDFEDAEQILAADTSSPRPVRRLKRPSLVEEEEAEGTTEVVIPHAHFVTPPTPHKDQHKRRRMSHPGHDIFSPCSSSVESSPSPTKASSARKRSKPDMAEDPLDEYNEEVDRSYAVELASKKARVDKDDEAEGKDDESAIHLSNSILRSLRPREKRRSAEEVDGEDEVGHKRSKKVVKSQSAKKPSSKTRSATTKNNEKDEASDDEEDLDAKWQRELEERIEYFKRLEDYQVEKEDVFLI